MNYELTPISFLPQMRLLRPPRCVIFTPVWPKASQYPGALLGRLLMLEWLPFINHFSPNRELWEQQSSQHVYTAGLQERTDGNTFENNPGVSSLTLGQTRNTFDIIKENVQVHLSLTELTCVLLSLNVYHPLRAKEKCIIYSRQRGRKKFCKRIIVSVLQTTLEKCFCACDGFADLSAQMVCICILLVTSEVNGVSFLAWQH